MNIQAVEGGLYMAYNITDKQKKVLEFIKKEIKDKGYPPSVREICQGVGVKSPSTVHGYLERLEKHGVIRRNHFKPRTIEIIDDEISTSSDELVNVPIIGKVAAGRPILAAENIEDTFPVPARMLLNSRVFMLKVKGESMIEAGILDGDYVLVKQQHHADNGDIVVALIEDEATVKRFYKEETHIRLQPANRYMDPIIVDEVIILGKIIGVIRFFT